MFELRAKSSTTTEILMYGSVGEWSKVRAEDIYKNLQAAKQQGYEKVKYRMNCPGGSIFEGIAIISAIQNSGVDVSIAIDGMAASMGAAIIAAVDDVEMAEGARIMIHQGAGLAVGQSWQMRDQADLLDSLNRTLAEYFAKKTGKDKQWILDNWMADGKDKWFTAREALDMKLIKRIIPGKAKPLQKEEASFFEMAAHYDQFFKPENKMEKSQLIALLGLKADATDAEIAAAITANKLKAEMTSATSAAASATPAPAAAAAQPAAGTPAPAAAASSNTEAVDAVVAMAKQHGMNEASIASLKVLAGIDAKAAMALIPVPAASSTQPAEKKPISLEELLAAVNGNGGGSSLSSSRKDWKYKDWEKNDPTGLMEMAKTKPQDFAALFQASFGYTPSLEEISKLV